jgi:hypothetical protein
MIVQIEDIRVLCTEYDTRDILNINETGLNWKRIPDRILVKKPYSGTKKSKDRIIIALTSNTDSSEKFEPWIIGK